MAETYSAGIVTAYGAARRGGYTGTYQEFCIEQAGFAEAAQQVRRDKESVEQTVETFSEETVPAAVRSVTDEGTRQIGLVNDAGDDAVEAVENAGTENVSSVNRAGSAKVEAVNNAGTTQVGNVNRAGTTQVQAVEDKGREVIASIPADYTALDAKVTSLNQAINVFDDIPGTTQTVNFGADGKPSSIIHTSGATTVRSDVFTWTDNTVTEVRTLADGTHITYVTNLDTLVTTISAIEEAS